MKHQTKILLLVSGIPATGKSSFCNYLSQLHGFVHYDLECYPSGWPRPDLKEIWDSAPIEFILKLRELHGKVAIDWGFPPNGYCLSIVNEFGNAGVRLIWFKGNIDHARKIYVKRGGKRLKYFNIQVAMIAQKGLPAYLKPNITIVDALTPKGAVRSPRVIYKQIFGNC